MPSGPWRKHHSSASSLSQIASSARRGSARRPWSRRRAQAAAARGSGGRSSRGRRRAARLPRAPACARPQRVLVAAALRGGEHALVAGQGDDLQETQDGALGARSRMSASGASANERRQALEVDREIRRRVPFRHLALLRNDRASATQALRARRRSARGPVRPERRKVAVREQRAGEIAGGVEEQRVVLAEIPLTSLPGSSIQ